MGVCLIADNFEELRINYDEKTAEEEKAKKMKENFINGQQVVLKSPRDSLRHGIGMVHQHFMLVEAFTVAENIILGNEVTKGAGILDIKKASKEIKECSRWA